MMAKRIFKFNKLVRDKIAQIIESKGCVVHQNKLEGTALVVALKNKLVEEANETVATKTVAELKEELADLMEVVSAIAFANNFDLKDIEKIRVDKKAEIGSFAKGIFISHIEIDEDNPAIEYYIKRDTKN